MSDGSIYGSTKKLVDMTSELTDSEKGGGGGNGRQRPVALSRQRSRMSFDISAKKIDQVLTPEEKRFILLAERGDCASVKKCIEKYRSRPQFFDINCMDPLGRSALSIAIINENPELMEMLLGEGIEVKDALLLAISEEYVEGVEILLQHEEKTHVPGSPYSWESVDNVSATYTPDITPLILAAHKNNYEILKILLDRGASLPTPHDLKCSCDSCMTASQEDSLRFSLSRINAYKALASPSLIALTSSDPILTAFQLSDELKKLKKIESQFSAEYSALRSQVQEFATSLLDHARTSYELEIMLNYDLEEDIWDPGETQTLRRLKLALKCKQKAFVAHPNVQQLLATIWYEGLPGWRRMNIVSQVFELLRMGIMFPIYCVSYMLAPTSDKGAFMKNPFVKFIAHSASYLCFLTLLAAASQRIERFTLEFIGKTFDLPFLLDIVQEWHDKERGSFPSPIECIIIFWVLALVWKEIKEIYDVGIIEYMCDLWNLADCFTNMCFIAWILLRGAAWILVKTEEARGLDPYIPREEWNAYDPYLIAEGLFGAGMISSFLKLVHIFSINPHLGPLQISLGRMAIDIAKFLVLYVLVLFAFGCGMNQLLWYYADLEYNLCYGEDGIPDLKNNGNACVVWRRFANLFETSQSLFWASFGLVSLTDFELTGIKEFTRFWALLMFGSYSVCNIIVLLNMLIAMMSNSFQIISERSDTEWKFSRTKLWISYFETGSTVPPPFNIIPTPKSILRLFGCMKKAGSPKDKEREVAEKRYTDVIRCIIRRYVTAEQKKAEEFSITEDDVSEIRQDINKFRYELIDILRSNNFTTPDMRVDDMYVSNKRAKQTERRILKGFNISNVDNMLKEAFADKSNKNKDFFHVIAKAIGTKKSNDWNETSKKRYGSGNIDHIGSTQAFQQRRIASFKKSLLIRGSSQEELNADQLVEINPRLADYTPHTRIAYAKFKNLGKLARIKESTLKKDDELRKSAENLSYETENETNSDPKPGIKKLSNLLRSSSLASSTIEESNEEGKKSPEAPRNEEKTLIEFSPAKEVDEKLEDKHQNQSAAPSYNNDAEKMNSPVPNEVKTPRSKSSSKKGTPVPPYEKNVSPDKTSRKKSTPIPPEEKPSSKKSTPIPPEEKPSSKKSTPIPPEEKPSSKKSTPIPPEEKPASLKSTPVPTEEKPLSKKSTPVPPQEQSVVSPQKGGEEAKIPIPIHVQEHPKSKETTPVPTPKPSSKKSSPIPAPVSPLPSPLPGFPSEGKSSKMSKKSQDVPIQGDDLYVDIVGPSTATPAKYPETPTPRGELCHSPDLLKTPEPTDQPLLALSNKTEAMDESAAAATSEPVASPLPPAKPSGTNNTLTAQSETDNPSNPSLSAISPTVRPGKGRSALTGEVRSGWL